MDATVDAQLQADGVAFTAADAALLRAIGDAGSVSGATDALGRSRARALSRIETLEGAFGPLVDRQRGGAAGGGSELTATAVELFAQFDRLRVTLAGTANVEERVIRGNVTDRSANSASSTPLPAPSALDWWGGRQGTNPTSTPACRSASARTR